MNLKLHPSSCLRVFKMFKKTSSSSHDWLERQRRDPYVKRAVKETYRARSAFKLLEMNERFKFIQPGDVVLDVGASPGSWTQVSVKLANSDASGRRL
jgi:23S rRNA (uridine2552-2'-O)-methyltransferase